MGDRLKGKAAIVTGGGGGIGREVALALAREGAQVVVNDPGASRDGKGAQNAPADVVVAEIKKLGGNAVANYSSVTDFKGAESIVRTATENFGKLDILVNVAGILREKMIVNMVEEDWDAVLKVHLYGTFNLIRHACPIMKEQRSGRIINTTSDAFVGTVGQSNYGTSKGGIVSLTYATAREMGRYGVTCNAIAPMAATRMTMTEEVKAGARKRMEAGIISKERYDELIDMPGPEFVPPIAVYLASDYGANINSSVFGCGGGKITLWSVPTEIKGIYKDYKKDGPWTMEEMIKLVPKTLLNGYINAAPADPKEAKGAKA